jgi:hypothetical protein
VAEEKKYIVQLSDGRAFGPADLEQVREWARQGSLPRQSVAIEEGTGLRMPVESLPGVEECIPGHGLEFFIPRNTWALISYYSSFAAILGLFFFCVPGALVGIFSITAGMAGLRHAKLNPRAKGKLHAWWGIAVGVVAILLTVGMAVLLVSGALS